MNKELKIEFNNEILEGFLIKENDLFLTVKLSSGYNATFEKSKVKIISQKEIKRVLTENNPLENSNEKLPNIAILHTGGTIASKVDYETGAVSSKFTPKELLSLYPDLSLKANLIPEMVGNLSSEDMRFEHWNLLLDAIKKHSKNVEGIIISHGTDTMHYTSAALQYSLENLNIPILLVGSQRSSDRASSDAYSNLNAAIDFIKYNSNKEKAFRRVGICMHSTISKGEFVILDAINAKKMHSSRRDAFKQINYNPYALLSQSNFLILRDELNTLKINKDLDFTKYDSNLKIGFFKAHPNLFPKEIEALTIYDCVILEGTGLGHLAVSEFDNFTKINRENLIQITKLIKSTKLVVGIQTVYGSCNMNIYSSGRFLKKTGVLGQDMNLTTESLFCRAAYLLSKDKNSFEKNWRENLEGFEIKNNDISY